MRHVPLEFKLLNRSYSVEHMSEELHRGAEAYGMHWQDKARIEVYVGGPDEHCEHTFYHELFHALFEAAGKPDLSKDEELVDVLGGLLHQYMTTKRGKFE